MTLPEFSTRETAEFIVGTWKYQFDDGSFPEDFWDWLLDNLHIYRAFVDIALQTKNAGVSRWSSDAICHVLRWQTAIRERGQNLLKINDHATAGLSRLARCQYPELVEFFSIRTPPAKNQARRLIDGRLYSEAEH